MGSLIHAGTFRIESAMRSRVRNAALVVPIVLIWAWDGGGAAGGAAENSAGSTAVEQPLATSSDGRRLVQGSGTPVLILGDSPQSLVVNLTVAEADTYFATRAAQGFNAAWVNVLVEPGTGGRPDGKTHDGIAPFSSTFSTGVHDLSTPNEAYFQRVDAMVSAAAAHGIHLWFDPIETIDHLPTLHANGVAAAREYGRFLGRRYKDADNIVWMSGNDFQTWQDSDDNELVRAVADGILDEDSRHLHTTQLDYPVSSSLENAGWHDILGSNNTYSYFPTYAQLYVDWQRNPHLPNVFIEGNYEGEQNFPGTLTPHVTTAEDCRNHYWWSMLAGAAGTFYGNKWVHDFLPDWENHMDDPGAEQARHVRALLESKRWYDLVPDIDHSVAISGFGTFSDSMGAQDNDYVTTARTADGELIMSYFPERDPLTIAMTQLSGTATASWFDPTTGATRPHFPLTLANVGTRVFTPPSTLHGDGETDWILVIEVPQPSRLAMLGAGIALLPWLARRRHVIGSRQPNAVTARTSAT
jgi:uncharacterized protein DUF4038/collagenase-like protein with putative collagen-binding domain